MSLLAKRAVILLLQTQTIVLQGQQVIAKEKATETLVECLTKGGINSRQAKERVRTTWGAVLRGQEPERGVLAPFVGVFYVFRACEQLGIQLSAEEVPGCTGVIDIEDVPSTASAIVPAERSNSSLTIEQISDDEGDGLPNASLVEARIPAIDPLAQQRSDVRAEMQRLEQLPAPVLARQLMQSKTNVSRKSVRVNQLERKVRNLQKQLATSKSREMKMQDALKLAVEEKNAFELQKLGKQREGRAGRWSLQSRFSMGLRCCLSTIAASDFSMISMVDVSRQTVLRAECITGASIISLMQSFCREGLSLALECGAEQADKFSLFGVGYRSDATNTNIWHRKKLHVCEATVMFLNDPQRLLEGDFLGAMSQRSCVFLGWLIRLYS